MAALASSRDRTALDAVAARAREAPRIDPRHAQAAIVENKREDLARDAARLKRLEKKMEGAVRGVRRRRRVAATPSTRRVVTARAPRR